MGSFALVLLSINQIIIDESNMANGGKYLSCRFRPSNIKAKKKPVNKGAGKPTFLCPCVV
jgi:hypothetical protein